MPHLCTTDPVLTYEKCDNPERNNDGQNQRHNQDRAHSRLVLSAYSIRSRRVLAPFVHGDADPRTQRESRDGGCSAFDASVYAFVEAFAGVPWSAPLSDYARTLPPLASYVERLRALLTLAVAKAAGEAQAAVRSSTAIDAIVMAFAASRGDVVFTGETGDLERLRRFFPSVRVLGYAADL